MKRLIVIFLLFTCFYSKAQKIKNFDLIIVINGEIIREPLQIEFTIKDKNDSNQIVAAKGYLPGNLSLGQSDYEKLVSDKTKGINIKFNYQTYLYVNPFFTLMR